MKRLSRRNWLRSASAAACFPALRAAFADPAAPIADFARSRTAIDKGLAYLAEQQDEAGYFTASPFGREPAVCALAGLALMASGHTPGRGKYGEHVNRCIDYLLTQAGDSGLIAIPGTMTRGPMYGHGFATLFLAEAFGMARQAGLRETLSRAVKLIVDSQNSEGGWRYEPHSREADISVTVCQVMALRAARNAGLFAPKATIDRAIDYVKRSQNSDGGFMYTLRDGGPSAFERSAAGVVALNSAGIYEGPAVESGLEYLIRFLPGAEKSREIRYYFYGHYYAVQAMHTAGGDFWQRWYPAAQTEILSKQTKEGFWRDVHGNEYATAMACVVLQTPNTFLPTFQR